VSKNNTGSLPLRGNPAGNEHICVKLNSLGDSTPPCHMPLHTLNVSKHSIPSYHNTEFTVPIYNYTKKCYWHTLSHRGLIKLKMIHSIKGLRGIKRC